MRWRQKRGTIYEVINSSVQLSIPAAGDFAIVLKAALGTLCERMRWPAGDADDLSYVVLHAFDAMANDPKCEDVVVTMRVENSTLQVELACASDLTTQIIDAVQDAAAGRVDRTEIDGSNRTITVTKTPSK